MSRGGEWVPATSVGLFGRWPPRGSPGRPAAIVCWVVGSLMIIRLVYTEIGVLFPVSGGVIRLPHRAFGSFAGFTAG